VNSTVFCAVSDAARRVGRPPSPDEPSGHGIVNPIARRRIKFLELSGECHVNVISVAPAQGEGVWRKRDRARVGDADLLFQCSGWCRRIG